MVSVFKTRKRYAVFLQGVAMKRIPLTKGKFVLVDDDDYEFLSRWKWYSFVKKHTVYAVRGEYHGYDEGVGYYVQKRIMMHRQIMEAEQGFFVDHINGDGLDNRRENLRLCTHSQNLQNQRKQKDRKYKGVYERDNGRFSAAIRHGGKLVHIGTFDTETAAACAYNKAAIEYFGEFANLNIIT